MKEGIYNLQPDTTIEENSKKDSKRVLPYDQLDTQGQNEVSKIIDITIKEPLWKAKNICWKQAEQEFYSDEDVMRSSMDVKKALLKFNSKNTLDAFNDKTWRKRVIYDLNDILNMQSNPNAIFNREEPLKKTMEKLYTLVADIIIEGISSDIQKEKSNDEYIDKSSILSLLNKSIAVNGAVISEKNKDTIINYISSVNLSDLSIYCGSLINRFKSDDRILKILNEVGDKIEQEINSKNWLAIENACKSKSEKISEIALVKMDQYFRKLGIDFNVLKKVWGLNSENRHDYAFLFDIETNMRKIDSLEEQRPGITKVLLEDFGIKEFKRYPDEALLTQFDQKDSDIPYGVILFSNHDHNQAFDLDKEIIKSLFDQTGKNNLAMRITEFESGYEMIKRLAMLNNKYGEKNKISYLLLGAHGSEKSFQIDSNNSATLDDLQGKGIQKLKSFFVKNPQIVLASCSTGAEEGIGQKISEIYDATVYAPNKPTNIQSIKVDSDLQFKVEYKDDDTLKTYSSGKKE